jgi:hypothetical protein
MFATATQPVLRAYVIVAVPGDIPVTKPVNEPILAIVVALLLHVPPPESDSAMVDNMHNSAGPEMAAGKAFTVIATVA